MGKAWDRFSDAVVDELLSADGVDHARGGGVPQPPSISAGLLQHDRWRQIMRRMRQWGVPQNTIGTEQPQPRLRPRMVGRGRNRRFERWITAPNQPDIQTVDPRTGRRIAVEVDTNQVELYRKRDRVVANNPQMRAAFELIDPRTGQPLVTHVWDPHRQRMWVHEGGVRRSDVLDFDV
jgi:hypothetical protein